MKKRILPLLLLLLLFTGCSPADSGASESSSIYLTTMDTVMKLTAYGPQREAGLQQAQAEILHLNDVLSIGSAESEISLLNTTGNAVLSPDTFDLLSRAMTLSRDTDGLFDPTVYPLVSLWGFYSKNYHVPTEEERRAAMTLVDYNLVASDPETRRVTLGANQSIDLGAIGKGYASQQATDALRQAGVTSAMLSLGGNVQCLGSKPDGSAWNIGIRDPRQSDTGGLACSVQVRDKAVITSGGYERYFVMEGKTYLHILDPRTGCPAESGLSSVSIITPDGTLGDGLSTALYIMGLSRACDYWRENRDSFDVVFITDDGILYATPGLKGSIQSQQPITFIEG